MQKKICLLGNFAVGKSSLMERFVKSIFSAPPWACMSRREPSNSTLERST
jgi:hypothetical protein